MILFLIGTYVPLLTNLIVAPALSIWLWRSRHTLTGKFGVKDTHPYTRKLAMLVESAILPLLLGLVHVVLFAAFQVQAVAVNVLWLSFTVLAPQIIALRTLQGRDHNSREATPLMPDTFMM
ncbi:hypothetical protein BKA70DRAFT_1280292, partial [Coprinopsis sp. MPI-PUGE-AT-0042]